MFQWMKSKNSLTFRVTLTSMKMVCLLTLLLSTLILIDKERSTSKYAELLLKTSSNTLSNTYFPLLESIIKSDEDGNVTIDNTNIELLKKLPNNWKIILDGGVLAESQPYPSTYLAEQIMHHDIKLSDSRSVTISVSTPAIYNEEFWLKERTHFLRKLIMALLVYAILLVLMIRSRVKQSLEPLDEVRKALQDVGNGETEYLEGDFPEEIEPLVDEVNNLLKYVSGLVGRYKNFASNLTHSINTPLFALYTSAQNSDSVPSELVEEKSRIVLDIVESNLARLKIAGSAKVIGVKTECLPVIEGVARAFGKVNDINVEIDCPAKVFFQGDKGDLSELVGNIIRNACQYATSIVKVSCSINNELVIIIVEDDGPGIPEKQREIAMERGKRLDEKGFGSGIGLSICKEIVDLYSGTMILEESSLGGLSVKIQLLGNNK